MFAIYISHLFLKFHLSINIQKMQNSYRNLFYSYYSNKLYYQSQEKSIFSQLASANF